MKSIISSIKFALTVTAAITIFTSCRKSFFYPGLNDNPNAVTAGQLTPSVMLNGAELSIGYTVGGDISRFSGVMIQALEGYNRQFAGYQQYIFSAQDFDNLWANVYEQGLNNLNILKQISDSKGYNYYGGISRVLLAYEFGLTSDLWGDVPRSQALKGVAGNLQPTYDKQQDIYTYLQTNLDSAIALLSGNAGVITPGGDDFIFNGSAAKWKAFAYALKARYYLHLSKVDNGWADKAFGAVTNATSANFATAAIPFFNNETQANPWYQYIQQRSDISYVNTFLNKKLKSLSDPRSGAYIDQTNDVLTKLLAGIAAPVTLMSSTELLFIRAEILSAKNDAGAVNAYNAAVQSAFADAGVTMPANYLVTNGLTGASHATRLPQIILQKYLALFTQPEPFNDWRRTGYPALTPTSGNQMPRRFLYPQAELSYNKANVPLKTTLFSQVWWDQ